MKIIFSDIKIFAHHGWYDEERKIGHWFSVDVNIELNEKHIINDDIQNTFNYEEVYKIVKEEMALTQRLLETVAQNILQKIMNHKAINIATVRLNKIAPYKMEGVEKVAIELTLSR
ncbi:MAG: dihydroneopterin aldolase [Bacteroidota bacterium]|jgi:dihydroneopterin aldolase